MNARTILLAPFRATHRSMAWLSFAVLALCFVVAACFAVFSSNEHWLWVVVGIYSGALFYLWAFFLCTPVLLAVDARWLRLPGMQRAAALSVVVYAALSLVPTLLIALLGGGNVMAMVLVSLLCVLGGLSFALMPGFIAAFMGLLPSVYRQLDKTLQLPGTDDPRFIPWALVLAATLLAICVRRWRTVLNAPLQCQQGVTGAMVLQYRRARWSSWGGLSGLSSTDQVRRRPDWMQARPDLRHVGPQHPGISLRVALGGWYLPRTLLGHLQSLMSGLLPTTIMAVVLLLIFSQNHGLALRFLWPLIVLVLGWTCMYGSIGVVFFTVMVLQQRWRKANAELSLLALLPGLGNPETAKREMLLTTLRRPLIVQALATLVLIAMAVVGHPSGGGMLMLLAGQLGCIGALLACVLSILGGRPLHGWLLFALSVVICLLIGVNSFLPNSMIGNHPWEPGFWFVAPVLGGWLLVGVALAWIMRRGWIGWRAQSHAFLPNR